MFRTNNLLMITAQWLYSHAKLKSGNSVVAMVALHGDNQ